MKACLICPSTRVEVAALSQSVPLANVPMLGKSLLEYWLEHLAMAGATHVQILVSDRPEMAEAVVEDGARWGLRAEVITETRELSVGLARTKYPVVQKAGWMPEPDDMVALTHFPGQPEQPLFASYADWFAALFTRLPQISKEHRIGLRELQPDVWVSARARIAPDAVLRGPCWIGEDVWVGPRSVIGPMSVVENRAMIEADCDISTSVVGPETMVGAWTELKESVAWGSTLINWKTSSVATVSDPFLLCALRDSTPTPKSVPWREQWDALCEQDKEELPLLLDQQQVKLP